MSEAQRDESEAQIIELIQSKLEAGDADSGWVMAFVMMKLLPHVRHIANSLLQIEDVLKELGRLDGINENLRKLRKGDRQ